MGTIKSAEFLTNNEKDCDVLGTIRADVKEIKSTLEFLLNESIIIMNDTQSKGIGTNSWNRDKKFG